MVFLGRFLRKLFQIKTKRVFLAGILVARHATLDTTSNQFPSYPAWFNTSLCASSTGITQQQDNIVINNIADVEFLLDILIQIVPTEPEFALRAQLTSHQLKALCTSHLAKTKLETYRQLARTHLLDLTNQKSGDVVNELNANVLSTAKELISEWEKTKKIPAQIMEASMFKQPFYQSQLLPALMICPLDDRLAAARNILIETLNSRGKVAGHLYKEFLSGELKSKFAPSTPVLEGETIPSEASLESVKEVLQILSNLPPDFQQEIESSLNKLRLLLVKLLSKREITNNRIMDLASIESYPTSGLAQDIVNNVCECLPMISSDISQLMIHIILENCECRMFILHCVVLQELAQNMVPLCVGLLQQNPEIGLQDGQKLKLLDFLASKYQTITKVETLYNIHKVYLAAQNLNLDIKLNNRDEILWLCGLRDAMKHVRPFSCGSLSSEQAKVILAYQLSLVNDTLELILRKKLFERLIEALTEQQTLEEVIETCLELIFCDVSETEQSFVLMACLVQLDRQAFLASADILSSRTSSPSTSLLVIKSIFQSSNMSSNFNIKGQFSTSELECIFNLVQNCKEERRLLIPLEALEVLGGVEFRDLPQNVRYSFAHYQAAGLLNLKDVESEVRMEHPSVFSWYDNKSTNHGAGAIWIGMLKLGELYLNGDLNILESNYENETANILQRIKQLTADVSQSESELLISICNTNEVISFQMMQASQVMMLKTLFSCDCPCPLYLIMPLIPFLSSLHEAHVLSSVECGILARTLIRKLDTYPSSEVMAAFNKLKSDKLNNEIVILLNRFFDS